MRIPEISAQFSVSSTNGWADMMAVSLGVL
jgi:hypothetical protein